MVYWLAAELELVSLDHHLITKKTKDDEMSRAQVTDKTVSWRHDIEKMNMNQVTRNVERILRENKIPYKLFRHKPVYTSEQAAKVRDVNVSSGVKALVTKTKEGRFVLVLVRADKRVDLKKVAKLENIKRIKLASPAEVFKITGCKIGAVPPFGHKIKLKTYLDKEILEKETINFNAGEHTISATMPGKDLLLVLDSPILFRN